MIGAIPGDMIVSPYEFDRGGILQAAPQKGFMVFLQS